MNITLQSLAHEAGLTPAQIASPQLERFAALVLARAQQAAADYIRDSVAYSPEGVAVAIAQRVGVGP